MQVCYAIKGPLGQLLHTWGKTIDIAKKKLEKSMEGNRFLTLLANNESNFFIIQ